MKRFLGISFAAFIALIAFALISVDTTRFRDLESLMAAMVEVTAHQTEAMVEVVVAADVVPVDASRYLVDVERF